MRLRPCPSCGVPGDLVVSGGSDPAQGYNFVVDISCGCPVALQVHSLRNERGECTESFDAARGRAKLSWKDKMRRST